MLRKLAVLGAFGLGGILFGNMSDYPQDLLAEAKATPISPIGRWYMGTATGFDCYLVVTKTTMTVRYGGCFSHQKPIAVAWRQQGDKITFDNAVLKQTLGTYLSIQIYQGEHARNIILVPEREQGIVQKYGYVYAHCFWKNLLTNGLERPQDAKSIGPGPTPTGMPSLKP